MTEEKFSFSSASNGFGSQSEKERFEALVKKLNNNKPQSVTGLSSKSVRTRVKLSENELKQLCINTQSLLNLAQHKKVLTEDFAKACINMLKQDPQLINGIVVSQILSIGYRKIWVDHGDIMNKLSLSNPKLAKFITSVSAKLSASQDKKFNRTEVILEWQLKRLIDSAADCKIVNETEKEMYLDLIDWDINNFAFVELDILKKVQDWDYVKLKKDAPSVLAYIKSYFEDWYGSIMKPHEEQVKKSLQ